MLEILDQSTARKTRHQPKGTNNQARQTTRKKPGIQVQQTNQGRPNTQGGKQTSKESTRRKRDREGRARGGDTPPTTGPKKKGRDKRGKGARLAGRETTSQAKPKGA